jgi:ribosomal-protein-alanine N-acetyltransferase
MSVAALNLVWATPDEAAAMAAAHAQAFDAPWREDEFEDLLEGDGIFGFLAHDDAPLGVILCRIAADEMEVLTIGVKPAARGRGVARALMTAALGAARQSGAAAAFLEVAVDNVAAEGLYASLGFAEAGLRRDYYDRGAAGRMDARVMRLDLTSAAT